MLGLLRDLLYQGCDFNMLRQFASHRQAKIAFLPLMPYASYRVLVVRRPALLLLGLNQRNLRRQSDINQRLDPAIELEERGNHLPRYSLTKDWLVFDPQLSKLLVYCKRALDQA